MKQRIVLLGPPASGKGTQAELMHARYQLPITSPGSILRDEVKRGTSLGSEAEKHTSRGNLVPAELVNAVMEEWLDRHQDAFVFDGYPRSIEQATALDRMLSDRDLALDVVLSFEAELETLRQRMLNRLICTGCGRTVAIGLHVSSAAVPCPACGAAFERRVDDTPETFALRVTEHRTKTEPLVNYFRERSLLSVVDARPAPEVVFGSIRQILEAE